VKLTDGLDALQEMSPYRSEERFPDYTPLDFFHQNPAGPEQGHLASPDRPRDPSRWAARQFMQVLEQTGDVEQAHQSLRK
jgi:hypothetical protein